MSERRYRGKQSRPIPVWNGVLEHRQRIDRAIWVFLWLLDAITEEKAGVGIVLGGAPVKASRIAHDLTCVQRTVFRHLDTLESEKYITRRRTPYGFVIEVCKSRKFGIWQPSKRVDSSVQSLPERLDKNVTQSGQNCPERVDRTVQNKEDAARNAAITQQQRAAAFAPNPEDSVWSFLKIHPCGPGAFRALLEAGWANRNGGHYSSLIGDTIDAWETTEGQKPTGCAPLFRALSKLRENEKNPAKPGAIAGERIHVLTPEEIPA
ncbi:MAG TPA: hypothetical protein VGR97_08130 [Candidatus Acidoferrales bacterium]|nr:hypothetical protein [Candidatus Acidoferrales bacterium]